MVVLREHLHCLWTLPDDDAGFSMRWRLIKREFSRRCRDGYKRNRTVLRVRKGEQAVWPRRFWEHQIRDERDFGNHLNYIHFNPVSHGFVAAPKDWTYTESALITPFLAEVFFPSAICLPPRKKGVVNPDLVLDEPLVNKSFDTLDQLAQVQALTNYHWWPDPEALETG
jgi:REP element-mobilizing transposase RayT